MKFVLFYESAPDFRAKAPLHFEGHRALWKQFHEAGTLLMVGPFTDAVGGAMAVFTTREAAEAFAAVDPFVTQGVAARWTVREWREALVP